MTLTTKIIDYSGLNGNRRYDYDALCKAVNDYNKSGNKLVHSKDDRIGSDSKFAKSPERVHFSDAVGIVSEDIQNDDKNKWLIATIELLNNPKGQIVEKLFKDGHCPHFSPNILGEYKFIEDDDGNKIKVFEPSAIVGIDFDR